MNWLLILTIIVFLLYLELGFYVFLKNPSSGLNRSFFYLCFWLVVWSFSYIVLFGFENAANELLWLKIGATGWCLTPAFMIRFKSYLTNIPSKQVNKNILSLIFFIPGAYFLFAIWREDWILYELMHSDSFENLAQKTSYTYMYAYLTFFLVYIITVLSILYKWGKGLKEKNEKKQLIIIIVTFFISLIWVLFFDITLPLIKNTPPVFSSHIISFLYVGGLGYGILKYRLFSVSPSVIAEKVIDEIKEILLFTDNDINVLKTNKYTQKLLGYSFSKIYKKPLKDFFADEEMLENYINSAISNDVPTPVSIDIRTSLGALIPANLYFLFVKDEFGDNLGFVIHGYDNRDGLKLEKEIKNRKITEQKLKNRGDLLEVLVRERRKELEKSYRELQIIIADRMIIEEQIKADISEKEVLINEIYNRVISNMNMIISLVNTQSPHNISLKAYHKLQEFKQRVRSMLLVQDNLYLSINYSDVDFANFLNAIIDALVRFYNKEGRVIVKRNISNVFLNIDYAIPLGLIANELIANALVHAFPKAFLQKQENFEPTVFISYVYDDNYYFLIVDDNGKKIPGGLDIENLKTTGLQLVDGLVKDQINGMWSINTERGSFIKVVFGAEK